MLSNPELQSEKKRCEERLCRVDGKVGTVEKVYQGRRTIALKAKVILETGKIVYVDLADVSVF